MIEKLIACIDRINDAIGRGVAWLALLLVLIQFGVVILRYVFAIGFIPLQESIWYLHGMLFTLAAGYTLLRDGHVRIDVFYRQASVRTQAWINLLGVLLLLFPVCISAWVLTWSYVQNSWRILERSTEVSGLPFIYLLKSVILIFILLVGLQGVSLALKSYVQLRAQKTARA